MDHIPTLEEWDEIDDAKDAFLEGLVRLAGDALSKLPPHLRPFLAYQLYEASVASLNYEKYIT